MEEEQKMVEIREYQRKIRILSFILGFTLVVLTTLVTFNVWYWSTGVTESCLQVADVGPEFTGTVSQSKDLSSAAALLRNKRGDDPDDIRRNTVRTCRLTYRTFCRKRRAVNKEEKEKEKEKEKENGKENGKEKEIEEKPDEKVCLPYLNKGPPSNDLVFHNGVGGGQCHPTPMIICG